VIAQEKSNTKPATNVAGFVFLLRSCETHFVSIINAITVFSISSVMIGSVWKKTIDVGIEVIIPIAVVRNIIINSWILTKQKRTKKESKKEK